MAADKQSILCTELRWTVVVAVFIAATLGATLYGILALHRNPPSNNETIDPKTP